MQFEEFALKLNAGDFASRSKAKAKPQRRDSASSSIHDRFQKDFQSRDSQLKIDRTEAKCVEMDEVAQKDVTYHLSSEEFERYKKTWSIGQSRAI